MGRVPFTYYMLAEVYVCWLAMKHEADALALHNVCCGTADCRHRVHSRELRPHSTDLHIMRRLVHYLLSAVARTTRPPNISPPTPSIPTSRGNFCISLLYNEKNHSTTCENTTKKNSTNHAHKKRLHGGCDQHGGRRRRYLHFGNKTKTEKVACKGDMGYGRQVMRVRGH